MGQSQSAQEFKQHQFPTPTMDEDFDYFQQ